MGLFEKIEGGGGSFGRQARLPGNRVHLNIYISKYKIIPKCCRQLTIRSCKQIPNSQLYIHSSRITSSIQMDQQRITPRKKTAMPFLQFVPLQRIPATSNLITLSEPQSMPNPRLEVRPNCYIPSQSRYQQPFLEIDQTTPTTTKATPYRPPRTNPPPHLPPLHHANPTIPNQTPRNNSTMAIPPNPPPPNRRPHLRISTNPSTRPVTHSITRHKRLFSPPNNTETAL